MSPKHSAMIRIKEGFRGQRSLVIPKMITDMLERDSLGAALHITDIGYYPTARHHFRERREAPGQFVLIYCVEGRGWYRLGDTRYDVGDGQFFILPHDRPHAYGSDDRCPWTIYWIHFNGTLAPQYAAGMHTPHLIAPASNSRISDRTALFEEIYFTLKAGYSIENLHYALSLFHHYLGSLRYIRQFRLAGASSSETSPTAIEAACRSAIKYMKENLERRISLAQIAQFTGYTPNHFSTIFKRSVGHAPISYFNLIKMQAACQMLDSTDMSINQIAAKLGFDDTYYFSRLFTKIMGMPPTAYRTADRG